MRFFVVLGFFGLACTVEAIADGGEGDHPQQIEETGTGLPLRERGIVEFEEWAENGRRGFGGLLNIAQAIQPVFSLLSDEAQEQFQQGVEFVTTSFVNLFRETAAYRILMIRLDRIPGVEIGYRQQIETLQRERDDALRRNEELAQQIAALEREIKENEDENEI